jgi:hypothetical protein
MTVPSVITPNDYTGNGGTPTYNYDFQIFDEANLEVVYVDGDGNPSTLTLNTDYTVSGVGAATGGSITLTAGNLATGHRVIIRPRADGTNSVDLGGNGQMRAIAQQLDNAALAIQGLQNESDRSLKIPVSDLAGTGVTLPSATNRAGKNLIFDAEGNAAVAAAAVESANTVVDNLAALQALNGDALTGSALMLYRSTVGDGGGGLFAWDASSSATADGALVVEPSGHSGNGRWLRQYDGPMSVRWFGATGDGATDDHAAIQACLDAGKGTTVFFPAGIYVISDTLTFHTRQILLGAANQGHTASGTDYGTIIRASAVFAGTNIARGSTRDASDPDFGGTQHWTQLHNLCFDCDGNCNGVDFGAAGEETLVATSRFARSTGYGILFNGTHAVLTCFAISCWDCLDNGIKFTDSGAGAWRIFGLSGDSNRPALYYQDGGFGQIFGLKYETRVDAADEGAVIVDELGGSSSRLLIHGGIASPTAGSGVAGGSLVTIPSGSAYVEVRGVHMPDFTYALDDQANSIQVPLSANAVDEIVYCQRSDGVATRAVRTQTNRIREVIRRPSVGSSSIVDSYITGTTNYQIREVIAYDDNVYKLQAESDNKDVATLYRAGADRLEWRWGENATKPTVPRLSRVALASAPAMLSDGTSDGAQIYITDGRKPGEGAGNGTGVPATWGTGASGYTWYSDFDGAAVVV